MQILGFDANKGYDDTIGSIPNVLLPIDSKKDIKHG